MIARIMSKSNASNEGKKLIDDVQMSFSAFKRLNVEMKKVALVNLDLGQFTFESDYKKKLKMNSRIEFYN